MKKALLIITCLLLMICLSGCGGKKIKTEAEMQADLAASSYLPEKGMTISNFVIDKRKTDEDNKLDTVYVSFTADSATLRYTLSCTLRYELFNDGWELEGVTTTSKAIAPICGITDAELAEWLEYGDEMSNAKLISRTTDLPNMKETLVFQCSRTVNAQTDTWRATLELEFDAEEDFEWNGWVTISDVKTVYDYSQLAGSYSFTSVYSPKVTIDVTVTPDGHFDYKLTSRWSTGYSLQPSYDEYEKSGTITVADFEKSGEDLDFVYYFPSGDEEKLFGFALYEGKLYRHFYESGLFNPFRSFTWQDEPYEDGGWDSITR